MTDAEKFEIQKARKAAQRAFKAQSDAANLLLIESESDAFKFSYAVVDYEAACARFLIAARALQFQVRKTK